MKPNSCRKLITGFAVVLALVLAAASAVSAQTTSFTYQGRLTDGGTAANGNYDLQFALFDNSSGGTQIGATQTVSPVTVPEVLQRSVCDHAVLWLPPANGRCVIFDWIQTMNSNGGDYRVLINGFLNSVEYRQRFGP